MKGKAMAKGTKGPGAADQTSGKAGQASLRARQPTRRRAAAAAARPQAKSEPEAPATEESPTVVEALPEAPPAPAFSVVPSAVEAMPQDTGAPAPGTEPATPPSLALMQGSLADLLAVLMRDTMRLSQDMARLYDPQGLLALQRQMLQQWFELATEGQQAVLKLTWRAGDSTPWSWITGPETRR